MCIIATRKNMGLFPQRNIMAILLLTFLLIAAVDKGLCTALSFTTIGGDISNDQSVDFVNLARPVRVLPRKVIGGKNLPDFTERTEDIRTSKTQDPDTKLELLLHRHRRGFGSWLKKVLHIKTTPKPTTKPHIPPVRSTTPEPSYSSEEARRSLFQADGRSIQPNPESNKVSYVSDQHGDTEIDWLLPKSLRRSSIKGPKTPTTQDERQQLKTDEIPDLQLPTPTIHQKQPPTPAIPLSYPKVIQHHGNHRHRHHHRKETITDDEEPTSDEPRSRSRHHRKFSHKSYPRPTKYSESFSPESSSVESSDERWRRIFGSLETQQKRGSTPERSLIRRRSKRSLRANSKSMTFPKTPITKISLEKPIESGSKEELRLLHELFINIVNGRCPKSLNSRFTDDIELNLFRIIDSSQWEDSQKETSPEMTTLIHQLVNCSVASESQKDLLEMFLYQETHFHSPSHDLELGSPVSRSKRGRLREKKTKKSDSGEASSPQQLTRMSNFEFSLISFISEECKHDVSHPLLHSASQLILDTIHTNFSPFIPISEEMLEENLNVLQYCAGVIMEHREKEMRLKRKLQGNFKNFPPSILSPSVIASLTLAGGAAGETDETSDGINNKPSRYFKRGSERIEREMDHSGNEELSSIFHDIPFVESQWKTRE